MSLEYNIETPQIVEISWKQHINIAIENGHL